MHRGQTGSITRKGIQPSHRVNSLCRICTCRAEAFIELIAMAQHFGIPPYFVTFTAAEGLWSDMQHACGTAHWSDRPVRMPLERKHALIYHTLPNHTLATDVFMYVCHKLKAHLTFWLTRGGIRHRWMQRVTTGVDGNHSRRTFWRRALRVHSAQSNVHGGAKRIRCEDYSNTEIHHTAPSHPNQHHDRHITPRYATPRHTIIHHATSCYIRRKARSHLATPRS